MISNGLVHAVELVKSRRARLEKRKKTGPQLALQFGAILLGILSVAAAILALAALPFYFYLTAFLPPVERLEELLDPIAGELLQPTRLYDRTGETLILTLAPEGIKRNFVSADEMPWLARAFVASNQPDFWQDDGFNLAEVTEPPDTIAEKLVSRVLLSRQQGDWVNNLRTNLLAIEMLQKYEAEQVLTWALNSTDFGHWAFGAESAAQLYFGKPASELTLAESALLAAVAQAPALNPIDAPELAVRFQRLVLTAMREQDVITDAELDSAVAEQLVFATAREPLSLAYDFTELALDQLEAELGQARVTRGGLEAITTLDFSLQTEIYNLVADSDQLVLAILDPINNRLLASYGDPSVNHDPGNLLSPFIYLSAFAQGLTPSSMFWLTDDSIGPSSLRQAFADQSLEINTLLLNNPSISINTDELIQGLGLDPLVQESGLDVLAVAQAFGVLSNNGFLANSPSPNTLLFVTNSNGSVEADYTHTDWQPIISPELTFLVNDMLTGSTQAGTTAIIDRPSALFLDANQSWLIAYSPQRVVSIHVGNEGDVEAGWPAIFEAAHRGLPFKNWEAPAGLSSVIVCVPSGELPDDDCPEMRREWFLRGNEPTEHDSLYERIAINILNGNLATVFTPEEFVQERVYLVVPPEGEAWAKTAGIPLPPNNYDPVSVPAIDEHSPTINQPGQFAEVGGLVEILGELGADAEGYDIQVGQGLRPTEWSLITEGETTPRNRELAEWNTEGLSGIWVIQLQAWDADGRIARAYTIVTIK